MGLNPNLGQNDSGIPQTGVPNSDLADMAQSTIKGRASGAGTGKPQDLTALQAATIVASNVLSLIQSSIALAASQITSGLLALARGGTNADLSATGGATHFLRQASTGAAVTVGAIVAADVPSLDTSKLTTGQLALARGGTHADLSATGGTNQVLKQSTVGGDITVGTITAGDVPTAVDATKIADGSVTNTEFQRLNTVTAGVQEQFSTKLYRYPWMRMWAAWATPASSSLAFTGYVSGPTYLGSVFAAVADSEGFAWQITSAGSGGSAAGVASSSTHFCTGTNPTAYIRFKTGANIGSTFRFWAGFKNATMANVDTSNNLVAAFRYSAEVPDGGFVGVTCNGTAASTSVTSTVAAIATNTEYLLRIRVANNGANIFFSVNGSAEQTLSTNVPTSTTGMRFEIQLFGVSRDLTFRWMVVEEGTPPAQSGLQAAPVYSL